MAEWQFQRDQFYQEAIRQGLWSPTQLPKAFPLGTEIPAARLEKWLYRLLKVPKEFASQRRYVNRFRLGADPEFVFSNGEGRYDARQLALKQGPAFGADNNGRLAEIRPYPSRSALEVVASIWSTFKWMAITKPLTASLLWSCSPYTFDDGLGGHVHFGRKRPFRDQEISALDSISDALVGLGTWPLQQVQARQAGDSHRQHYGLNGDWRIQSHGYEYRTFPSWLDSPALAFLVVTLSKLAVHNPSLVRSLGKAISDVWHYRLKNFLAYYKDVDDDARLALTMLGTTFGAYPRHMGGDFKMRWGITMPPPENPGVKIVPSAIRPTAEEIQAMFVHLSQGKSLPALAAGTPTWSPVAPPAGYKMLLDDIDTYQVKGLGEIVCDLCYSNSAKVEIKAGSPDRCLVLVGSRLVSVLPAGWEKQFKGQARGTNGGDGFDIWITPAGREHHRGHPDMCRATRRILTSGAFPIWQVGKVKPESYDEWRRNLKSITPRPTFVGKVLYQSSSKISGIVLG